MTESTVYAQQFYQRRHQRTLESAERVLDRVADIVPPISSAIDIGCGVGTWLSVLGARGADTLRGYDGPWVDDELLEIRRDQFTRQDLTQEIVAPAQRYDIALSMEVAEHLPADSAPTFVRSLTNQSDIVLFSAATPHQGGTRHLNEQWIEYWVEQFDARDYIGLDVLRQSLWWDDRVSWWYRQNAVLFVARDRIDEMKLPRPYPELTPISLVHPRAFEDHMARHAEEMAKAHSLKGSWKLFRRALRSKALAR